MSETAMNSRTAFEQSAQRYVENVLNEQEYGYLEEILAENAEARTTGIHLTPDRLEDMVSRWHAAFPDFHAEMDYTFFDDQSGRGAFVYEVTGTFENEWSIRTPEDESYTFAPTGESFTARFCAVGQHDGEQVVELDGFADELDMLVDLGLVDLSELSA